MKRTLVISDIHGCYREFIQLLELAQYQPEQDRLIILGDMIDRGKQSLQVVQHIMQLKQQYDVIVLAGNHEELFCQWVDEPFDKYHTYVQNGGWKTIESYCKPYLEYGKTPRTKRIIERHYQEHITFFKTLPNYFEDDKYIYVHAGVDLSLEDWKNSSPTTLRWVREEFWEANNTTGKTIIFGHTPTSFFHKGNKNFDIWQTEDGKICIDGGCSMGGKLHALCLTDNNMSVFSVNKIR